VDVDWVRLLLIVAVHPEAEAPVDLLGGLLAVQALDQDVGEEVTGGGGLL